MKLLIATVLLISGPSLAIAQVSRTFVSNAGNDANDCLQPATPCRTLNGAISKVNQEGEVLIIDSGSYAGANITKSVKVTAAPGILAFTSFPITVAPGPGGTVVLRGLTLRPILNLAGTGITHSSGTLFLENMLLHGWSTGLQSTDQAEGLLVKGSVFRNNSYGIETAAFRTSVDRSHFENNVTFGLLQLGPSSSYKSLITNSTFAGNGWGVFVGNSAESTLQRCNLSSNSSGGVGVTDTAVARVGSSTLTKNEAGLAIVGAGPTIVSFGNNQIDGNVSNVTGGALTPAVLR